MNDLLIIADNDGKIRHVNSRVLDLFEYEEEDLAGSHIGDLVADEEFVRKTFIKIRHKLFHRGEISLTCRMKNSNLIPLTVTGFPVSDGNGQVVGVALVGCKAVSLRQEMEPVGEPGNGAAEDPLSGKGEFKAADEKFRSLVEQSLVGIFMVRDDKFMYVNPKMAEIFGYCQEELTCNIPLLDIIDQRDRIRVAEKIEMIASGEKKSLQFTFSGRQKDGSIIDVETYGTITDYDGGKAVIGSLHEITERKLMEEAIRHQAYHDSLTSLPNRILFNDRLVTAIAKAHRDKLKLAVMFLDLDRFKNINDTLGHTVGDMLLQSIAGLLRDCLRESDTVARLGGDEYTILLSQINDETDALSVAQKILSAVNQKWVLDGHRLHLTTSIGISIYPNDGSEAETLIRKADTAMYHVKAMGGNAFRVYDSSLDEGSTEQARLESDLRVALENGELQICYQPQVDILSKRVTGVEALLRWNHPELGLLQPKQFIHLAEKTGLIVPIGEWVLRMACLQAKAWDNNGFASLHIAVNVSAVQLQQHDFVDVVENVLKKTSFAPELLKLEITESVALQNLDAIVPKLTKLTDMGVRFAIDDFGMGYSSLNYLKRLPIQTIKIDRSFMNDLTRMEEDASIVTAVIAMAKSLNLDTIAEGVETEEQMNFLNNCHCDKMQGFLFSHPLPAKEVEKLFLQ